MIVRACRSSIAVHELGEVDEDLKALCIETLENVYCSLDAEVFTELILYATREEKLRFLESEAAELGVLVVGDFKTLHEAWRGYPRIHVSQEDVKDLPKDFVEALVAHEAIHSVLHGSPTSYLVYLPPSLIEFASQWLSMEEIYVLAYVVSAAIKDVQVHRAMASRGLVRYLEAYARFCASQLSSEDCREGASVTSIANAIKLLTPFAFVDLEPPACAWLMSSESFRAVMSASLDDVPKVMEVLIREFAKR